MGRPRGPGTCGASRRMRPRSSTHSATFASSGTAYEAYEPAYRYGYDLGTSERYQGRDWVALETDARRDWEARQPGTWTRFQGAIRHAWEAVRGAANPGRSAWQGVRGRAASGAAVVSMCCTLRSLCGVAQQAPRTMAEMRPPRSPYARVPARAEGRRAGQTTGKEPKEIDHGANNGPEVMRDMPLKGPPAVETSTRPVYQVHGEADRMTPPIGVRVRWGGVTSGWIMALGTLLLLTT